MTLGQTNGRPLVLHPSQVWMAEALSMEEGVDYVVAKSLRAVPGTTFKRTPGQSTSEGKR